MFRAAVLALALLGAAASARAQAVHIVPVDAEDLAYSPLTGRLYASVTATNSITEIDPVAGTVGVSFFVGSQPNKLAISDTGEYLFVGLDGAPAVVRVHLPTRAVGTPFLLGAPDPFLGPKSAEDLEVMPGNPNTIAVALAFSGVSPQHAGVAVYDGGVERPTVTPGHTGSNVIEFGASAARLYGHNNETTEFGFRRMNVTASGVTILESTAGLIDLFNVDIEYHGGRIYTTSGRVIDAEAHTGLATFSGLGFPPSQIALEPTSTLIYYVTELNGEWRLKGYDPATFVATFDEPVPDLGSNSPRTLVSVGPDALALATSGNQVIILPTSPVPAAPPAVTITGPTTSPALSAEAAAITLSGTASDPNVDLANVAWTTSRGYAGVANGATSWTAGDIPLVLGSNVITVTATDMAGNTGTDTLDVTVTAFSSFLAEGSTGTFFDYDLALANPSSASVDAEISYFTQSGATVTQSLTLPARSRRTIRVDDVAGLGAATMSTQVRSTTAPIVVERTMRWGTAPDPQYGAHGDKATAGAATKWYFAEGAQGSFFTYLLLANPGGANTATIDWLIEGGAPVQRTINLPAASRTTIDAGADQALAGRSFGIVVTFTQPAVAERAMYFGTSPLFNAGHDSAGVTTPSTRWFLAEGATGPFFETFILLANPNPVPADATLQFLTQSGVATSRVVNIPAMTRRTIDIEGLSPAAPELANQAVATIVTATQPIIAERAQYWPGVGASWYEAHNSFGVMAPKVKWGLAEGRVGNPPGVPPATYQTYLLLANPGNALAHVTVTFLRESGTPVVRTFNVPPERRLNVAVAGPGSSVPELADEHFGALIESDAPIVVERAMYGNAGTQVFGIGTNATATPLP